MKLQFCEQPHSLCFWAPCAILILAATCCVVLILYRFADVMPDMLRMLPSQLSTGCHLCDYNISIRQTKMGSQSGWYLGLHSAATACKSCAWALVLNN